MSQGAQRVEGVLVDWNDERGFGFIAPSDGSAKAFAHVTAFPRGRRPAPGVQVTYLPGRDGRNRPQALRVQWAGRAPSGPLRRSVKTSVGVAAAWAVLLGVLVLLGRLGLAEVVAYAALSLLALYLYASDKSAARRGAMRTPESTLLLVGVLGGWPGALIARHTLRHKTTKEPFRTNFWCSVAIHCGALALWAVARPGLDLPF